MPAAHTARTMCPMNCHPTFCGMLATVEGGRLTCGGLYWAGIYSPRGLILLPSWPMYEAK